jgi:hypothetical protein
VLYDARYGAYTARCPGTPPGRIRPTRAWAVRPKVGAGLVRAISGQSPVMADLAGAAALSGFEGVAARARPGWQLPAGGPLIQ